MPTPSRRPPRAAARLAAIVAGVLCLVGVDARCTAPRASAPPAAGNATPAVTADRGGPGAGGGAADRGAERVVTRDVLAPRRVTTGVAAGPPALASDAPARLERAADLVRLARSHERQALAAPAAESAAVLVLGVVRDSVRADSARDAYDAAAALAPDIVDWLRLRRMALEPSAAIRAQATAALATPAARERAVSVEAMARLRAGDLAGAAAAYEAAGRPAAALAVRAQLVSASPNTGARDGVRAALLRLAAAAVPEPAAGGPPAPGESPRESARLAALLLDSAFAPLPAADQLVVARALGAAGDRPTLTRAAAAYGAALSAGAGTPDDQLAYGRVLAGLRRWRDAAGAFARVPAGSVPAADAAYERARALLRAGDGVAARAALRQTAIDFARDGAAAAARVLLADLTADDGREADARAEYLRIARDHASTHWAPAAALRAGVLAMAADDARAAAEAFDLAATRWPDADERFAARYWAGRAYAAAGDSGLARERWEAAITAAATSNPGDYYAWQASRRLGREAWVPGTGEAVPSDSVASAAARRAALCERLGLMPEAGWEREWLARWADTSTARLLAAAGAMVRTARPGPGIRLGQRAVERGAPRSAEVWRLLYPLRYAGPLAHQARAADVDPALAAALVKQESNFTADAVSPAGARGLMQVMPAVGRAIWRGPGAYDPALLFRPEVNIALGMRHLRAALAGWPDPAYALAAYNAGGSRVRRWRRKPGATDPELFVERIPFAETRDYVRIVLRNQEFYRALYGW